MSTCLYIKLVKLSRPNFNCIVLFFVFFFYITYHVRCMSLFVTADLCIISLGFFEIRFATFEYVFMTVYFCHCGYNKQLTYLLRRRLLPVAVAAGNKSQTSAHYIFQCSALRHLPLFYRLFLHEGTGVIL